MNPTRRPSGRPLKFLLDANVFVATAKSAWKHQKKPNSLTLLIYLVNEESVQLIGNKWLIDEYTRYSTLSPVAEQILTKLLDKMRTIKPDMRSLSRCIPYFQPASTADAIHAATCLKEDATLITNDSDFDRIKQKRVISVWSTARAIRNLLFIGKVSYEEA